MASVDELIDAIDNGDELTAQKLIEQQPTLVIGESLREGVLRGATPLHWAAHRDMTDLCERLIQSGADANARRAQWWRTPLAWAADAGCAGAVELLLKRWGRCQRRCVRYDNSTPRRSARRLNKRTGKLRCLS